MTPAEMHAQIEVTLAEHPSRAEEAGVYVLECDRPNTWSEVTDKWHETMDADMPDWLYSAWTAEKAVYVGASYNVYGRLIDHVESKVRRSTFLRMYPPKRLVKIHFIDDPFDHEGRVGYDLRATYPSWYVYTDAIEV